MKIIRNFVNPGHDMFESSLRSFLPKYTIVPFNQADGVENICAIEPGSKIEEGQIVASSKSVFDHIGSNIHSAIPGELESIVQCTLPNGHIGKAAKINLKGSFTYLGKKLPEADVSNFDGPMLLDIFKAKGVVNTFSSRTASLSSQIKNTTIRNNRFVVIRMFDEDPSRYTDSFIAEKFTDEVTKGILVVAKAFEAKGVIFVLPKKTNYAINSSLFSEIPFYTICADNTKYPAGFKENLIRLIRKSTKNPQYEQIGSINHKSLFIDPQTAYSAYEAVFLGIPVMERFVHVTGKCLKSAAMFKVRIGTEISSLVEQCGGFKINPSKIVINGTVTGNAVSRIDIPITKSVKSVTFIPSLELCDQHPIPCVRCGRCRAVCPEGLFPDLLYKNEAEEYFLRKDIKAIANLCSQCSLCNSVCPSRLSLSQTIQLLKDDIK